MAYKESLVYTNTKNIERNQRDIDQILNIFQGYNIRSERTITQNAFVG